MSKYTTEVRFICEMYASAKKGDYTDIDDIIKNSMDDIFNDTWTTYDSEYKSTLCYKILSRYYFNEIGFETVGLWKHFLNQRLAEIMPYYNQMYQAAELDFIRFDDIDYYTDHSGETTTDQDATENETTNRDVSSKTVRDDDWTQEVHEEQSGWDMYSDTPQGGLDGIESNTYLTNARKTTKETDAESSGTDDETTTTNTDDDTVREKIAALDATSTSSYLNHVYGKYNSSRSYADAMKEIYEAIVNIDQMIMDELSDLFMLLW